jgi:hypothetical protein
MLMNRIWHPKSKRWLDLPKIYTSKNLTTFFGKTIGTIYTTGDFRSPLVEEGKYKICFTLAEQLDLPDFPNDKVYRLRMLLLDFYLNYGVIDTKETLFFESDSRLTNHLISAYNPL